MRELFRKVRLVRTGKSGGRAKPPDAGSPVKFEMLNTLTPGEVAAGIKTSKEMIPTGIEQQSERAGSSNDSTKGGTKTDARRAAVFSVFMVRDPGREERRVVRPRAAGRQERPL